MKVVLLGAGDVLVSAAIYLQKHSVPFLVVAGPRHMGEKLISGETYADTLKALDAAVLVTDDVNRSARLRELMQPGLIGLSIGAPWIFTGTTIDGFEGFLYNMHNAPLPEHRGGGGFSWRIMMGDRRGCCLIHQVDERTDTGPIVQRLDFEYPDTCRIPIDYIRYTNKFAVGMVEEFLSGVLNGGAPIATKPQRNELSSYWPRLNTDQHGWIDWSWSAREIERFICAFDEPYAGAQTYLNGTRTRLKGASLVSERATFHPFQAGIVYRKVADGVVIACRDGGVLVSDVSTVAKVGDRFHTPPEFLQDARTGRVRYNAQGMVA